MKRLVTAAIAALAGLTVAAGGAHAQRAKDTFRLPLKFPIDTINYIYSGNVNETQFSTLVVYDTLVFFDEEQNKYTPLLAKSWKRLDDKTVEFELRDDVKWHDGQAFGADDVVDSLNWLVHPDNKYSAKVNWEWIDHAEKVGPHTVRLHEKRPTPYDLARLTNGTDIQAAHIATKMADRTDYGRKEAVGTGMYKAVQIDTNKGIILEKNPDWKLDSPAKRSSNIGKVVLLPIPDPGTQVAQLLAGGVDAIKEPELDQVPDLLKDGRFTSYVDQRISYVYMAIDAKGEAGNKALTDVRVRQALFKALDLTTTSKMSAGEGIPPVPAMCWKPIQAGCDYSQPLPKQDIAGAKKLLADAGYPNGFDIQITCYTGTRYTRVSTVIAEEFRQIGLKPSIQCVPAGTYLKMKREAKVQLVLAGFPAGSLADAAGVLNLFASDRLDFHGDNEIFGWARQHETELDPVKRNAIGKKIFDAFFERAYVLPVAPLPVQFVLSKELVMKGGTIQTPGVIMSHINWAK